MVTPPEPPAPPEPPPAGEPAEIDCAAGFHAPLVARPPVEHGDSVSVDHVCPACGTVEFSESWTKAAWRADQRRVWRSRKPQKPAADAET